MNYSFGFSWAGLIVFLLPMIANIFYFMMPKEDESEKKDCSHLSIDVLEKLSQAIFIFMLMFIRRKEEYTLLSPSAIAMIIMLLLYYLLWVVFFKGKKTLGILLGLAIFPVMYFVLAEVWLQNYLAIIPTVVFGITHVIITCKSFQLKEGF